MSDQSGVASKGGWLKWALVGVAIFGVAAVLYIIARASSKPELDTDLKSVSRGEMKKLETPLEAAVAPPNAFQNAAGEPVRIADFKGKIVVLNLWATWCAPCVAEMPTLGKLAASYAGKPVVVAAVSVDSPKDVDKAKTFIGKYPPLVFYSDPQMKMPFAFKPPVVGMPTTIIYGADGLERARLSGGADWSGSDARAVIDKVLAQR